MGENGSKSFSTPFWDPNDINGSSTIVLHPLGGCVMGKDRTKGVVNIEGKVFDGNGTDDSKTYDGLYVVDGAIVPTSLGVNSSLTIAALAFMIAERCVGKENIPVEIVDINGVTYYMAGLDNRSGP
jgi:choline dehydrogenase-like flavoprotein